jgi:hypothetical protein
MVVSRKAGDDQGAAVTVPTPSRILHHLYVHCVSSPEKVEVKAFGEVDIAPV